MKVMVKGLGTCFSATYFKPAALSNLKSGKLKVPIFFQTGPPPSITLGPGNTIDS